MNLRNVREKPADREFLLVERAPVTRQALAKARLIKNALQAGGQTWHIARLHQTHIEIVRQDRPDLADRCANHRDAAGQRFQNNQWQTLVV